MKDLYFHSPVLREKFAQNWQIWWLSVKLLAEITPIHFCWQIWWQSVNYQQKCPPFFMTDLVTVSKTAGRNTLHPFLLADLVTISKSTSRNTPPFVLADSVTVSRTAGRNPPISAGRFGGHQEIGWQKYPHFCWQIWWQLVNLPAEIPLTHFCQQIWWQSVHLPAEIPPFLLADLVTVSKSSSRKPPISAGRNTVSNSAGSFGDS